MRHTLILNVLVATLKRIRKKRCVCTYENMLSQHIQNIIILPYNQHKIMNEVFYILFWYQGL